MSRDKLITIRIESDLRDAFNEWCELRNTSCSKLIYETVKAYLDGRLDKSLLYSQMKDKNFVNKLDKRIDNLERQLDDKIDKKLDNTLKSLITTKLNEALANLSLNPEFISAVMEGVASRESQKNIVIDQEADLKEQEKLPNGKGFSDYQLAKIVGLSPSTLCRYRKGQRTKGKDYERVMKDWKVKGARWYKLT